LVSGANREWCQCGARVVRVWVTGNTGEVTRGRIGGPVERRDCGKARWRGPHPGDAGWFGLCDSSGVRTGPGWVGSRGVGSDSRLWG